MKALSPLIIFVLTYLGGSMLLGDFYKLPLAIVFLVSCIYAITINTETPLKERIDTFCKGMGQSSIMLMICIFILAGAFASAAKAMGCINATVELALFVMPSQMIIASLFLAACFISISIGTSVGTIVALVPIASEMALATQQPVPMLAAAVVGGAFFGDNLSFISDTTIVATTTQGCAMRDKFRTNIFIALPAAAIVCLIYAWKGMGVEVFTGNPFISPIKVIPYIAVLIGAIIGMNVLVVLIMGILLIGLLGTMSGALPFEEYISAMGNGIMGMSKLIIVTMLAGGMLEVIRQGGGINYIINSITRHVKGSRGAQLSCALLVSVVNVCTANNTIAILAVGDITNNIAKKYDIAPRRMASILDTFSCTTQGLLPYGAQLLMASGLAAVSPFQIIPHLYYPFILGIVAVVSIWHNKKR